MPLARLGMRETVEFKLVRQSPQQHHLERHTVVSDCQHADDRSIIYDACILAPSRNGPLNSPNVRS